MRRLCFFRHPQESSYANCICRNSTIIVPATPYIYLPCSRHYCKAFSSSVRTRRTPEVSKTFFHFRESESSQVNFPFFVRLRKLNTVFHLPTLRDWLYVQYWNLYLTTEALPVPYKSNENHERAARSWPWSLCSVRSLVRLRMITHVKISRYARLNLGILGSYWWAICALREYHAS